MADVVLENVSKRYGSGIRTGSFERGIWEPTSDDRRTTARRSDGGVGTGVGASVGAGPGDGLGFGVEELNLRIADREFLVLVGPSGCGKSTTLRLIAGLETLTAGRILIGGRIVNSLPPAERDIAMVFQNYALYPHMTVEDNLAFGLRLRYGGGISARLLRRLVNPRRAAELAVQRRGIGQRVRQAAERLGILHLLGRKPHELSGGERQRVALGRAIVRDPAAFLFDEPLSNLDAKLRQAMRSELKQLHENLGATTIYVTHDQVEAMTLGQRVAVMDRGRLQQIGSPEEIYDSPANLFVARFFGSTPINLLPGQLVGSGTEVEFVSGQCRWRLGPASSSRCRHWPRQVTLGVRGEDLHPVWGSATLTAGQNRAASQDRATGQDRAAGQNRAAGQAASLASSAQSASLAAGPETERWRLPPLAVRQIDNWGDSRVVELGPVELECETVAGGTVAGGTVAGGDRSLRVGNLVAKLPGELPVKLRTGESLEWEWVVSSGHWFDSATGCRLEWSP